MPGLGPGRSGRGAARAASSWACGSQADACSRALGVGLGTLGPRMGTPQGVSTESGHSLRRAEPSPLPLRGGRESLGRTDGGEWQRVTREASPQRRRPASPWDRLGKRPPRPGDVPLPSQAGGSGQGTLQPQPALRDRGPR